MKNKIPILLLSLCFGNLIASEDHLPRELERLQNKRSEEIAKIDKKFIKELERLKKQYMRRGDLDNANLAAEIIARLSSPRDEAHTTTKWTWQNDGGELILYKDGRATHSRRKKSPGTWKLNSNGSMFLNLGSHNYIITFRDNGIGYVTHIATNTHTTITPKKK